MAKRYQIHDAPSYRMSTPGARHLAESGIWLADQDDPGPMQMVAFGKVKWAKVEIRDAAPSW